jgi:hypothetical protein
VNADNFYHVHWWAPAVEREPGRPDRYACIPTDATEAEVEIRYGNGYSKRFAFAFDMEQEYAVRTYRLFEFIRMLDLMFLFGIGEGKRQIREVLGVA